MCLSRRKSFPKILHTCPLPYLPWNLDRNLLCGNNKWPSWKVFHETKDSTLIYYCFNGNNIKSDAWCHFANLPHTYVNFLYLKVLTLSSNFHCRFGKKVSYCYFSYTESWELVSLFVGTKILATIIVIKTNQVLRSFSTKTEPTIF